MPPTVARTRKQEFQEQMVVSFIKVQFISNSSQVQVILLSTSRSLLFLFFFALFCFLWHLLFFPPPSFSVWLFSSGLRSFLVEETPSAAQMIIAELQFHSSDSLRWGTVDFLCIMERQREGEKERSEEKGSVVSQSRPFHGVLSVCVREYASLFGIRWHTGYFFWTKALRGKLYCSELALSYLRRQSQHGIKIDSVCFLYRFS